jgi:hypothetical protein
MTDDAYVPVEAAGFEHIYAVMHGNLRNALKHCQDYATWLADQDKYPDDSKEKLDLLEVWLAEVAERYAQDTSGVTNRGWEAFDGIVERDGSSSPSGFEAFGVSSQPAMRPYVKQLEDANLVASSIG